MKKLILLLFLASTTLFVSCGSDDDSVSIEIDESLIPGNWALTAISIDNGKSTTEIEGQSITADYTSIGKDFSYEVIFSDTTVPYTYISTGGYTAVVTTTVLGQTNTQEQVISDFLGSGEWSVDGNKLTTTTDGAEQTAEITVLDEENFSIKMEIDETLEVSGYIVTTKGTFVATMTRI